MRGVGAYPAILYADESALTKHPTLTTIMYMYMFIYNKVVDKDPTVGKWNVVVCFGTVFMEYPKEMTQSPHYKTMEQKQWWFAKLLPIAIYSD